MLDLSPTVTVQWSVGQLLEGCSGRHGPEPDVGY
jgi:hypothetical protein